MDCNYRIDPTSLAIWTLLCFLRQQQHKSMVWHNKFQRIQGEQTLAYTQWGLLNGDNTHLISIVSLTYLHGHVKYCPCTVLHLTAGKKLIIFKMGLYIWEWPYLLEATAGAAEDIEQMLNKILPLGENDLFLPWRYGTGMLLDRSRETITAWTLTLQSFMDKVSAKSC